VFSVKTAVSTKKSGGKSVLVLKTSVRPSLFVQERTP